ncbi:FAD-binding domain-containing protein [uncultured Ferrimonas sp.]|uniref:cryptochrome/photolyase family protein n=1 Tax=uncultured Ferrimonas sp. TaxID=432640 RepID=UPI00262564F9|nr:FAD-binding domain-containing protein [uncultured Ferrimonas sp.]
MKLVWLRSDLRLNDNPALYSACQSGEPVAVVFVATPRQWQQHHWGNNKISFIAAQLQSLRQHLNQRNIALHISCCDDFSAQPQHLHALMQQLGASWLLYNAEHGYNEQVRDNAVAATLTQAGLGWQRFAEHNLLAPEQIRTGKGEPYRVFTPFMKKARRWLSDFPPQPLPAPAIQPFAVLEQLNHWQQIPTYQLQWPVGEDAAWQQLQHFCQDAMNDYQHGRDIPAINGTSRLSPYLTIGVLSSVAVYHYLQQRMPHGDGATTWINELLWREFYRYLMHHFPALSKNQAMYPHKEPKWDHNPAWFARWQQGNTGFPMVDAGMRELAQTGWMHNRLRMLCASFLVKDLHLDWRLGEAHFMTLLIDGDFASNNGGWQWAAGCGADAAPYFRHFSPTRQAQRFDPKQQYQTRYVPELADGRQSYSQPMVDHKQQCQQFSQRVKALSPKTATD